MRRRLVRLAVVAVTIAVVLIGVPFSVLASRFIWDAQQSSLDTRTETLARSIERRLSQGEIIDEQMLDPWVDGRVNYRAHIIVIFPDGTRVETDPLPPGDVIRSTRATSTVNAATAATVIMEVRVRDIWIEISQLVLMLMASSLVAFGVAVLVSVRGSRRVAAPLLYLAAAAEQLGSGQTRPNIHPSGIEEIDLVQDEIVRTADRVAARLAAERQFAANASHQLRTPLTGIFMRLEEIQYLTESDEVRAEAEAALAQVERLSGVVEDLLRASAHPNAGSTEALNLGKIFAELRTEWTDAFHREGRSLILEDSAKRTALATPGAFSQVLATLIENSLKYGAGTTRVITRPASTNGLFIDVSDEGEGVSDEIAGEIFTSGVSGRGSTGIGLALAKDLVTADGGRLELTQRKPPVFTIFLNGLPENLGPDSILPLGNPIDARGNRLRR